MPPEFPFDEIRLREGESIEFSRLNPTFHRSVDFATAISERALYVRAPRVTFRRYWQRVELADIRAAELRPAPFRPWLPVTLGTPWPVWWRERCTAIWRGARKRRCLASCCCSPCQRSSSGIPCNP